MSFLNFNYSLFNYEDQSANNPIYRNTDITESFQGVNVSHENTTKVTLNPGQTSTIVTTLRSLAQDGTTQYAFSRPVATDSTMRLTWTGTGAAPLFRTARALGVDATTTVSIVRVGPNTARLQSVSGTALDSTAVSVGDTLKFARTTDSFTSPFGSANQNQAFLVQAKGSSYIDFLDNGAVGLDSNIVLGTNFASVFRVFSSGPVAIGDTISVGGGGVSSSNHGQFALTDVNSDYIEFLNPYGVAETVTVSTNTFKIYDHLIGFIHLKASAPISVAFDGGASITQVGLVGSTGPALLAGSVNTYQIDATNNSQSPVALTIRHMAVE